MIFYEQFWIVDNIIKESDATRFKRFAALNKPKMLDMKTNSIFNLDDNIGSKTNISKDISESKESANQIEGASS